MGGAEQQMSLLMEALVTRDSFDITYLTRQAEPGYEPIGYAIEKIPFRPLSMRLGNVLDVAPLLGALKRIRPHVIYQRVGGMYTGVCAWYARHHGARMVWHISSDMNVTPLRMDKNRASNVLSRYIEKKALEFGIRHSDRILAQTRRQTELLKQYYGIDATRIVPNFQPVPDRSVKEVAPVQVVWVSNLKPLKRPELFIDLARRFDSDPDVRFIMVGRPENSAWCRRIIACAKQVSSLQYVGEKTQDEVSTLLAGAHMFVNTSRYEGFPNTFIQAWMREVPVVSLDVDPDDTLVTRRIGYRSGSFEALVADVERLVHNRDLREGMGAAARRYAVENHSGMNIDLVVRELMG